MRVLALGFAALLMAGAAHADTLTALKENTLVLTDRSGNATGYLLSDDGTFEQSTATASKSGKWEQREDGRLCLRADGATFDMCLPQLPAGKAAGDAWEVKGPSGAVSFTAKIVEGRVRLDAGE
jgi:hypothetical protein